MTIASSFIEWAAKHLREWLAHQAAKPAPEPATYRQIMCARSEAYAAADAAESRAKKSHRSTKRYAAIKQQITTQELYRELRHG